MGGVQSAGIAQPPLLSQSSVFSTPLRGIHGDKPIKGSITQMYFSCLKMLPGCSNSEGLSLNLGIQSTSRTEISVHFDRHGYLHSSSFAVLLTCMRKASVCVCIYTFFFFTQILQILCCNNFFLLLISATRVKQVGKIPVLVTGRALAFPLLLKIIDEIYS